LKERGVDVLSSKKPFGNEEFLSLFKEGSKFFAIGHQNGTAEDRDFAPIAPPPIPRSQVADVGVVLDGDGYQRRGTLYPITNPPIPGLGWALALKYLEDKGAVIDGVDRHGGHHLRINGKIFAEFSNFSGPYVRADDGGYQVYLHWRKANFNVFSVSDVLDGKIAPEGFQNKIVILGAFAPSLNDQFSTPLSASLTATPHRRLYGIEAIAQVASYIISAVEDGRPIITTWREPWLSLSMLASCLATGYLFLNIWREKLNRALLWIAITSTLFLLAFFPLLYLGLWLPLLPLSLCVLFTGIAHYVTAATLGRKRYLERILSLNKRMENMIERRQSYRLAYSSMSELGDKISYSVQSFLLLNKTWNIHEKNFNDFIEELNVKDSTKYQGKMLIAKLMIDLSKALEHFNFTTEQLSLFVPTLSHLNGKTVRIEIGEAFTKAIDSISDVYLEDLDFRFDVRPLFKVDVTKSVGNAEIEPYRLKTLLVHIIEQPLRECSFGGKELPLFRIEVGVENSGLVYIKVLINYYYAPNELSIFFCEELFKNNNGEIAITRDLNQTIWNISLHL
jgi:CHASE2 domain-containing sensor protein